MKKFIVYLLLILISFSTAIWALDIELGQPKVINIANSEKIVIENPDLIKIEQSGNSIQIYPLKRGKTYLYSWNDQEQLTVYPINIIPKGYGQHLKVQEKLTQKAIKNPNNIKIKTRLLAGSVTSSGTKTNWGVGQLEFFGKSSFGNYKSNIQFENRDNLSEMVMAFFQLKNEAFEVSVGDSWGLLSTLSLPYLKFQGAQINKINLYDFDLSLLAGVTGQEFWGSQLWTQTASKNYFAGGKITKKFNNSFSIFGTAFYIQERYQKTTKNNSFMTSLGSDYILGNIDLKTELAFNKNGSKGLILTGLYKTKKWYVKCDYKNIDNNYTSVPVLFNLAGTEGFFNRVSYAFSDTLKTNFELNSYKRKNLSLGTISEKRIGAIYSNKKYLPKINISYWELDQRELPWGMLNKGFYFYADQWLIYIPSSIYIRYKPFSFENTSTANTTYDITTVGITNDLKYIKLDMEARRENSKSESTKTSSVYYSLAIRPLRMPTFEYAGIIIKPDFTFKYDKHYLAGIAYDEIKYFDLSINFKQEIFDDIYLSYSKQIAEHAGNDENFKFGITTLLDSGIKLPTKKYFLDGVIFEDINKNGIQDHQEKGLQGIVITMGPETAVSDANGYYKLSISKSPYVNFSTQKYPEAKILINNPTWIDLDVKTNHLLNVPVSLSKTFKVIAYFDANNNERYDEKIDQLIPNISFIIKDGNIIKKSVKALKGELDIEMNKINPDYTVNIDLTSIPQGVYPKNKQIISQKIDNKKIIYFPFKI